MKATAELATAGSLSADNAVIARAEQTDRGAKTFAQIDSELRSAVSAGKIPGVVALAATDNGIFYEGIFGSRRLQEGPAMTRDTLFRIDYDGRRAAAR